MKKLLVIVFILLFFVCFIFVHHKNQDSKIVLKFSSWGSQSETAIILPLIKNFEKENPDIKIEFLHIPQNYFQKLHLLFASNLAPDVVFINNYYAPKYIQADLLEDLTQYINKKEFFEKSLEGFTYNNKIYAIPRDVSDLVIYYNKDIFRNNNIPYPKSHWTIDEYIKTAQLLSKDTNKDGHNDIWGTSFETDVIFWLPYLMSDGASILSDDGKEITITNPNSIKALNKYSDIANKYNAAPKKSQSASLTMAQLFLQEKIAMHLSGRWLVPKYRKEASFDWDIINFPNGKKGSVVNIDSSGYAIAKSSKHKKEALKFVQYMSSKNSLDKLTQSGLIVPARKDTAYSKNFLDGKKPLNSIVFLKAIQNGKATPVNTDYQRLTDKLSLILEPVFLGKEKAEAALSSTIEKFNR